MARARKHRERNVRTESARTALVLAVAGLYTGFCAEPSMVALASSLWLPPVVLSGYLLGQRAGVGMGVYVALPLALAWYHYGVPAGASFPGLMVSTCVAVGCGSVLGRIHDLSLRLRERLEKRRIVQAELRDAEEQSHRLLAALPDRIYRIDRAGTVLDYQVPRGSDLTLTRFSHTSIPPARSSSMPPPRISSIPPSPDLPRLEASLPPPESGPRNNIAELLSPDVAGEAIECINEALETGEVVSFEYQIPRSEIDGGRHDYEARLVKGGEHEVIAIVRDVTRLKLLQSELDEAHRNALQAAGTKGRFLATMSHQIRNPMNGVIGMTNVLLQTKLSPEQREYTSIIRNSGEALLSILDDVLDYTKIEAGKMELGRAVFPLRSLMEEIVELLSVRAHDKGLEIASLIDARVPDRVMGDRGRLRQVITNLLGNAIRFTARGHVALRVTVVGHDRDTAFIRFDISDTGVGISREQQKNLFQDFGQANPAIAREFGGTGLGLAISRQIVELMGGHMLVESAPGEGSTFSFTARFGTAPEHTTGSVFLPRSLSGAQMLAVLQHPLTRDVLEHQLAPFGARMSVVKNAAEAERMLEAQPGFDLMLVELPIGARESDAQRVVRETLKIARSIPIGVLCGMGHRNVSDAAREAGAALTLSRPLRRGSLYEGLGNVLGVTTRPGARPKRAGAAPLREEKPRARVLVAEDNLVNQKVAVRSLEMLGCDAEVAENGALAVEALKHGDFDIVLMDCQMPVLDGFHASAAIRAFEGSHKHTPIIAMTANAMQGDRERCLAAGMDDYMPKPVTLTALDATLRNWLPERVNYQPRAPQDTPSNRN